MGVEIKFFEQRRNIESNNQCDCDCADPRIESIIPKQKKVQVFEGEKELSVSTNIPASL